MKIQLKLKIIPKLFKVSIKQFSDQTNKPLMDPYTNFSKYKNMNVSTEHFSRQVKKLEHFIKTFDKEDLVDYALFNQSYLYHLKLFRELSKIY